MSDVLNFPAGVLQGRPFASPEQFLLWAAANPDLCPGWDDPRLYHPVLVTQPRELLDEVPPGWTLTAGYDRSVPVADLDTYWESSEAAERALQPDPGDRKWLTLAASWPVTYSGQLDAATAVVWWRQVRGLEALLRRLLPSAKSRRAAAAELARAERAVDNATAAVVAAANVWITTIWADCIAQGRVCDPADPHASDADRRRSNPAGTPRLGF